MLHISANDRLAYITEVIKDENIRFPNAVLEQDTGWDSGNISKMLKGKIPIPDSFFTAFLEKHPNVPNGWLYKHQPLELGGLKRTLQDYVEQLETHNSLLNRLTDEVIIKALAGIATLLNSSGPLQKTEADDEGRELKNMYPEDPSEELLEQRSGKKKAHKKSGARN